MARTRVSGGPALLGFSAVIFLSVGTQLPFDRLTRAIDDWCAEEGTGDQVFGQIGKLGKGSYLPKHFEVAETLSHAEFVRRVERSALIVGHAGMGSIISALTYEKPIVIMPRLARLGEHRNDHQLATVARFRSRPGIIAADDESVLRSKLEEFVAAGWFWPGGAIAKSANPDLIKALRGYILG